MTGAAIHGIPKKPIKWQMAVERQDGSTVIVVVRARTPSEAEMEVVEAVEEAVDAQWVGLGFGCAPPPTRTRLA